MALHGSFDYFKNIVQGVADGVNHFSGVSIKLDEQMHDLTAVAGVTGDGLKQCEIAREFMRTRQRRSTTGLSMGLLSGSGSVQ